MWSTKSTILTVNRYFFKVPSHTFNNLLYLVLTNFLMILFFFLFLGKLNADSVLSLIDWFNLKTGCKYLLIFSILPSNFSIQQQIWGYCVVLVHLYQVFNNSVKILSCLKIISFQKERTLNIEIFSILETLFQ